MTELVEHEKTCPERLVKCAFRKTFLEVFLQFCIETLLFQFLEVIKKFLLLCNEILFSKHKLKTKYHNSLCH